MPEWIDKPALPMDAPGWLVIPDFVVATLCACCDSACDQGIRILTEYLDAGGCNPKLCGAFPAVISWLPKEEWRTGNLQSSHRSKAP